MSTKSEQEIFSRDKRIHIENRIDRMIMDIGIIKQEIIFSTNFNLDVILSLTQLQEITELFQKLRKDIQEKVAQDNHY